MPTETTPSTKVTANLPAEKLEIALLSDPVHNIEGIHDLFDRCVLANKLILLKDTAFQIKNYLPLEGDHLDVGIEERYLIPEVVTTLREQGGVEDPTQDFTVIIGDVPVKVKVIKRHFNFFANLDGVVYNFEILNLPNPFEKYWRARFIVQ